VSERVVVFGATSAIALEIARAYAARGARLFLVARNAEKLAEVVAEFGPVCLGSVAADLADTRQSDDLVQRALAALGQLDVAVVAQGYLGDQLASERDVAEARRIVDTNLMSVVALVIPLANHFEARRAGKLVVLGSVAGERGRPRNYTYGAAKGALRIYLQGVRARLGACGVGVHLVKLGPVDTPMTVDHRKNLLFARPPGVANAIVRAVDAGRGEPYVPWFWWWIMAVVRAVPDALFRRIGALQNR